MHPNPSRGPCQTLNALEVAGGLTHKRLTEPPGGDPNFEVLTYASDIGEVGTMVTVPFYVMGRRWGCALVYYVVKDE